jgi:hypothetical protein
MDIEVDLYSGRPNPVIRLDPTATDEISRRLGDLPPSSGRRDVRDGLGYRGLRLTGMRRGIADVMVSDGVVEQREESGATARFDDPGRALEGLLVALLAAALDPEVLNLLRADLAQHAGEP